MRVKRVLKELLPKSAANAYRRYEESRALATVPVTPCDVRHLATRSPELRHPSDWPQTEQRVAFGQSRAKAVNSGDQRLIYSLTRSIDPRHVLEIGTNVGGSTVMFAVALGDGGRLITVDIVDVNGPEGPAMKLGCETPAELLRRMKFNNVDFVRSPSTDFMRACSERFDLIFLDGAHEAEVVYQEIPLALALLRPNGFILLLDFLPDLKPLWSNGKVIPGPWLAIERLKREGSPLRVEPFGALPWATKLDSNMTSLALLLQE